MVFLNRNPPARKNPAPIPIVEANPRLPPSEDHSHTMLAVLADAGCTLRTPSGPPLPPSDPHKLRQKLETRFSASPNLLDDFLCGFSSYIDDPENLKRFGRYIDRNSILAPCGADLSSSRTESLARMLLLVPQLQLQLQKMLLEKLPEHFGCEETASIAIEDDAARLIINHFRWLDFLVDCKAFVEKLLEVLTICPIRLKKDIIGSLPEIIGDQSDGTVVSALERMLQEDSEVVVPVLDSFSNLNLDDQMQEQVVTIALSCIRTIDAEHMPFLLRFLLLSATPVNAGRIIAQIRELLIFTSMLDPRAARNKKLKGKSVADNADASILEALRSSLRFKNILCEAILKELKTVDKPRDHKVIDAWLIMLIYANGGSLQKNAEKIIKKKITDGSFSESLFDQCIRGHRELAQVLGALVAHIGSGVGHEVNAALETMVYEVFSHLALSAQSSDYSVGSSIANELLMIVRKQINNQDLKYKKMGIIGTLKLVTFLGDTKFEARVSSSQKTNSEEALELLNMSLDSCKLLPLALILFYDELVALLESITLHPSIMECQEWRKQLDGLYADMFCLHFQYFVGSMWKSLTGKQKQIVSLSLYYAINWLRELLNGFSSQVAGKVHCVSQNTRGEVIAKLLKRLKNLVFLEGLLNISLKRSSQSLPEVHLIMEHSDSPLLSKLNHRRPTGIKTKDGKSSEYSSQMNKRKRRASSMASEKLEANGKLRQTTILDALKRAGVVSQEVANEVSSGFSCKEKASQSREQDTLAFNENGLIEISAVAMFLDVQKIKFRPLLVDCLFILSFSWLPIHLYLLRDFHYKLDYLTPPSKQSPAAHAMTCKPPAGLGKMTTTSEVLVSLESLLNSIQLFLDKPLESNGKNVRGKFNEGLLPVLRNRLGDSACKLLSHDWGTENHESEQKRKAEIIQKTLRIYLKNNESTSDLVDELTSSILPKLLTKSDVQHEENLEILKKLLKQVGQLEKSRAEIESETVEGVLTKLRQSTNVVVSLVNMCKTHDKCLFVIVICTENYRMENADTSSNTAFNFLQANFKAHNDIILQMLQADGFKQASVKELQKATRTIQIVCSEAKGLKRTMITSKIPATKRSMERFLFHVKALLHNTSNGETFWMGNLKHKDLLGQVVSSQVYANGDNIDSEDANGNTEEDKHMEAENECEVVSSGQVSDETD
ncbi:hypothetical protein ACLOJK_021825 [Asimina triloba]